jgi:anti-sigma factor RsiW
MKYSRLGDIISRGSSGGEPLQLGSTEQETLRQYLLGRLPSDEFAPLEERLMTDSAFYEELLIVEDELIDQYLRGQQPAEERESFENHFLLTAERQQKTRFARSLKNYLDGLEDAHSEETIVDDQRDDAPVPAPVPAPVRRRFWSFLPENPIFAYPLTVALVLVVGAVSWLALKNLREPVAPDRVLVVVLTPGVTRGTSDQYARVQIPSDVNMLQVQLVLPSVEFQSYRAELTSERIAVWTTDGLQLDPASGNKSISFLIPVRLVKRDDYQVKLSGRHPNGTYEDVATYVFRVVK